MNKFKLFFAVTPSERQVTQLIALQHCANGLRHVNPDNFHMTLFYAGSCDDEVRLKLIARIDQQMWPKFSVKLDEVVYWRKPRILCVNGRICDNNLQRVVKGLEDICVALGFNPAPLPFNPHITILRKVSQWQSLAASECCLPLTLQPHALHLYHSRSSLAGVQYDRIATWPLT